MRPQCRGCPERSSAVRVLVGSGEHLGSSPERAVQAAALAVVSGVAPRASTGRLRVSASPPSGGRRRRARHERRRRSARTPPRASSAAWPPAAGRGQRGRRARRPPRPGSGSAPSVRHLAGQRVAPGPVGLVAVRDRRVERRGPRTATCGRPGSRRRRPRRARPPASSAGPRLGLIAGPRGGSAARCWRDDADMTRAAWPAAPLLGPLGATGRARAACGPRCAAQPRGGGPSGGGRLRAMVPPRRPGRPSAAPPGGPGAAPPTARPGPLAARLPVPRRAWSP